MLARVRDQWNINRAPHFPSHKNKIEKEDQFFYLQENVCDELGTVATKHHHILQATLHKQNTTPPTTNRQHKNKTNKW